MSHSCQGFGRSEPTGFSGDDPGDQTRAAIGRIVRFVDEDRRRARVLFVEALGSEPLNRRRIETGHALVAAVEQLGLAPRAKKYLVLRSPAIVTPVYRRGWRFI